MKILYLVPDLFGPPGGIARYCRLVARTLCESTSVDRVDILALWDQPDVAIDSRYLPGDKASYTSCGGNRAAFASAAVRAMMRRVYDLVLYGHVGFSPLRFALIPRFLGSRHITFIYGMDAWDGLPFHKRRALQASDRVIAISHYTGERAASANGLDRNRLRVLHNCLDPWLEPDTTELVSPIQPVTQAWAGRAVVTVSRLLKAESGKGHDVVLRALPKVLKRVPDLNYVIIGDGDLRLELEQLAHELGVSSSTHFMGALSDIDVGRVMDTSELYVMPSRQEGFGFVFLEAMARGLPVIAGNRDASPEVLGGDAGILVDPDSVTQVADAMLQLLSDPVLRRRLGLNGLQRLNAKFRYPRFKDTLLAHLSEVLDGGLRTPGQDHGFEASSAVSRPILPNLNPR